REQMAAMLLDLNCKVVGEEPDEDPEKPPIQIFERARRQRPASGQQDRRRREAGDKSRQADRKSQGKPGRKGGGPRRDRSKHDSKDRPQNFTAKSREPDPDSPFAVLAGLKLKS
ncbi:MAG: disulfide oxidoreductase, partial [Pseudomonadota bacterium]|nr:disulfide oxidoreductase [Pseudomonadota bacterium]